MCFFSIDRKSVIENESSWLEALVRKYRSGTISEEERAELLAHAEQHETLKALLRDMLRSFPAAGEGETILDGAPVFCRGKRLYNQDVGYSSM